MTPHPQKHCDHECVCAYYVTDRKPCTDENQYPANKCPHDTRCASHSSAPTEQEIRDKVLEKIERAHDCLITEIIHARAEDREYLRIKKAADILLGLKLELRTPTPEAHR